MKYTRYDLKKANSDKTLIVMMFFILILAFVLGTIIFRLLVRSPDSYNNKSDINANASNNNNKSVNNNISKLVKFIIVQGGIYQNKENADAEKILLNQYGTPFSVVEGNKTRVLLGIYSEEQGQKIIKSLTDQKIDNSKITINISNSDLCDSEITEIISANLQILNKLAEKNVKSIQTDEIKKWCSSLNKVDENSKNISILNDLKDNINKMPKDLSKDKAEENYIYIYNLMNKMKLE
ncbi:SPOR domain-containing protein [Clostridium sp. DJ247]|uniref:SPOR domain-containing protein n=1 Tax=Clostridium sp. DJ247 TaxID=2726188 RepID=UPI0016247749|nr:SPOR domain-containing protein [Clostridium sp. DJ247]MBC2580617.1 SPOR domain-containing protein [Clostridium sp. DJ247]